MKDRTYFCHVQSAEHVMSNNKLSVWSKCWFFPNSLLYFWFLLNIILINWVWVWKNARFIRGHSALSSFQNGVYSTIKHTSPCERFPQAATDILYFKQRSMWVNYWQTAVLIGPSDCSVWCRKARCSWCHWTEIFHGFFFFTRPHVVSNNNPWWLNHSCPRSLWLFPSLHLPEPCECDRDWREAGIWVQWDRFL